MATINNVAWDFQNLETSITLCTLQGPQIVTVAELPIIDGSEEINYSDKLEDEEMWGSSRTPQGETDGVVSFDGSLGLLMKSWDWLHNTMSENKIGWAQARLNISLTFTKPNVDPINHLLYAARIMGNQAQFKRGQENLRVTMPIRPRNIYRNGVDPFGKQLTQ